MERLNWCKLVLLSDLDTDPASFVSSPAGDAELPWGFSALPVFPTPGLRSAAVAGEVLHEL